MIDRLRLVAKHTDATLNDVVLAMCAGALRRYLLSRRALPAAPLMAMVPVCLRGDEPAGAPDQVPGNKIGTLMCSLATHLADPAERLAALQACIDRSITSRRVTRTLGRFQSDRSSQAIVRRGRIRRIRCWPWLAAASAALRRPYGSGRPGFDTPRLPRCRGRQSLAVANLMSLFGLHRWLRGAAIGHFAATEITSPPGSRRLVEGLNRRSAPEACVAFYREHVEADAVHEQVVRIGVVGDLVARAPQLDCDVVFGMRAHGVVEDRLASCMLASWKAGQTSLCRPLC